MLARKILQTALTLVAAFSVQFVSAHAETLTVGPDPAAFEFTEIQAAVDAAREGDVVRVAPGEYAPFEVITPITVLGAGSDKTFVRMPPLVTVFIDEAITVRNVFSGSVRIGGFGVLSASGPDSFVAAWVLVFNCLADVELFDLHLDVEQVHLGDSGFIRLVAARSVVLSGCRVTGGAELPALLTPGTFQSAEGGYNGLDIHSSSVWASDCTFEGCAPRNCVEFPLIGQTITSGAGARVAEGQLVLSNSRLVGGRGAPSTQGCASIQAGAGLRNKFGGTTEVHVGPDSLILGGNGDGDSSAGPGALLGGPSFLFYPPNGEPVGGMSDSGVPGACMESLIDDAVIFAFEDPQPTLSASAYLVSAGSSVDLQHTGNPNAVQLTFFDFNQGSPTVSLPLDGAAFVDPLTAMPLTPFILDGSGTSASSVPVPGDPALVDLSAIFQTAEIDSGLYLLSAPIVVAIAP